MITYTHRLLGLLLFFGLFFSACHLDDFKEVEGLDHQAEFAIPLVNSSVSIQDLLDQSSNDLTLLTIESDGSFTLSYQDEAAVISGNAVMTNFPDYFPIPIPDHQVVFSFEDMNGIGLESGIFRSGEMSIELTSSEEEDMDVTVTFPGITKNNQALQFTSQMKYQGNSPEQHTIPAIDLSGYEISTQSGNLEITYEARNASGQNRLLDAVVGIANNWKFQELQGEWKNVAIPLEEENIELDIYKNLVEGELHFTDPRLQIVIDNSFGVPVLVQVEAMEITTQDGATILLQSELVDQGFLVAAPENGQQGEVVQSTFSLNRSNSNIETIFNASPKNIVYRLRVQIAPGSGTTSGFILDDSQLNVKLSFELPVYGTAKNFTIENSVELDLGDNDNQNLKEAQLKLITQNELPIEAGIQLYFVDENGQKTDSVFNSVQQLIAPNAPPIITYIDLTPERLENLRRSKNILVRSELSTTNQGTTPVRIFNHQEMSLKLGLRATVEL